MKITIETPQTLGNNQRHELNDLAAIGFGFEHPGDMFDDTMRHIDSSDFVQQAYIDETLAGLAFYKRSLWQSCN
jgi:hypothetical protein